MAFTPHTQADIDAMLQSIGVDSVDDLFSDIPADLMLKKPVDIPELDEFALQQFFEEAAAENQTVAPGRLFLGAGAYNHYCPAAVKNLINRGEFVTCYTPYQAEVSQGTLQAIFEFQSHICALTRLEVANASMYDGATALAEALTMAARKTRRNVVWLPETLHPSYRAVAEAFVSELDIEVRTVPEKDGVADFSAVDDTQAAAVVAQTPNFYGIIEDGSPVREAADRGKALLIAVCNPTALAILNPPGEWGADIVVGEAQPLGLPLQYGGPYAGFFASKQSLIRVMPGRIAGKTTDDEGREGLVLTLQTREQHIRRERATSNICTNQGLFALMATMYLTFVGKQGLVEVAESCLANTQELTAKLTAGTDAKLRWPDRPHFHEAVVTLPVPAPSFLRAMREDHGIVAGLALGRFFPERPNDLLVCATELNTEKDIDAYVTAAKAVLAKELAPR